jgi:hypothetical protein
MIDGATSAHRVWLGICLSTDRGFVFWRLTELPDQTSATICNCLTEVIQDLNARGFRVIAIVTDNASNEIKALQNLASSDFPGFAPFIFRIACLSHTLNLALVDFARAVFEGWSIYKDIPEIRETIPCKVRHFLPSPCPTRWTSLGNFVRALIQDLPSYEALIRAHSSRERRAEAVRRWDRYDFVALAACLTIIDEFVDWTEAHAAVMTEAWAGVTNCAEKLYALGRTDNPYADAFADKLMKRMTETANFSLLILSHLVTRPGLAWYRDLPATGGPTPLSSKESVRNLTSGLLEQFRRFFTADPVIWSASWNAYLTRTEFPGRVPEWDYWAHMYEGQVNRGETGNEIPKCWLIGMMAKILLRLPCSEAEVERLFSLMRSIFGTRSQATMEDLLEARLFLMLHRVNSPRLFCDKWYAQAPELELPLDDLVGRHLQEQPTGVPRHLMAEPLGLAIQGRNGNPPQ